MSKPFCLAPWVGLYVTNKGLSPCCYMTPRGSHTFDDYINSDWLKGIKKSHLSGDFSKLPDRCKMCMSENNISLFDEVGYNKDPDITKVYLEESGYAHVNLAISTKCGMACKMCLISDKRFKELNTLLDDSPETVELNRSDLKSSRTNVDVLALVEENKDNLKYLSFFGGDPTMELDTAKAIDMANSDTVIRYSCNGQLDKLRDGELLLDKLKRFDRVDLAFSLDGVGELGSYIRKGIRYSKFDEMFFKASEMENVNLSICVTVSLWNVLSLIPTFEAIYEKYISGTKATVFLNPTTEPRYAAVSNLPFSLKIRKKKEYEGYLAGMSEGRKMDFFKSWVNQLNRVINYPVDKEGWNEFIRMEQYNELNTGTNIKHFVDEYRGYL